MIYFFLFSVMYHMKPLGRHKAHEAVNVLGLLILPSAASRESCCCCCRPRYRVIVPGYV